MEQKFKNLNTKIKDWKKGQLDLNRTFEAEIFKESEWFFLMGEGPEVEGTISIPEITQEVVPPVSEVTVVSPSLEGVLVLFIGDNYQEAQGEDLLGKMIKAMKLKESEFVRLSYDERLENIENLAENLDQPNEETKFIYENILKHRPAYVVTLGAIVTNLLLGRREKLSGIHGQFFNKSITLLEKSYSFEFMPLFHPEFLVINPNMKRTAWIDLQQLMLKIGKN